MPTLLDYVMSVRTMGWHSVLHKVYDHEVKNDSALSTGQTRKENENTISHKERQNSPKNMTLNSFWEERCPSKNEIYVKPTLPYL